MTVEAEHLKESWCANCLSAAKRYGQVGGAALGIHILQKRIFCVESDCMQPASFLEVSLAEETAQSAG